jgi:hypothetical protein
MKEKLMVKKTKVIAFRVNADEYEALQLYSETSKVALVDIIRGALESDITAALNNLALARKKAEAKAKRLAKKEATSGL